MEKFLHKNEFLATEKLLNSFKIYLKFVKNYSENTIASYFRDIKQFFEFVKKSNKNKVDKVFFYEYLIYLQKDLNLTFRSINRKISSIKKFISFLEKEKYIKYNPIVDISHYKIPKKTPEFLNFEEIEQFLNFDDKKASVEKNLRDKAIVELLYSTGLRVSELVSLNIEDLDFENNLIKVVGKGKKERIVIFGNTAKEKIKRYLDLRSSKVKKGPLFVNLKGKRLTSRAVQLIIKERAVKCGILKNVTPHVLRHTFATHLLNQGMDIRLIQKLLGHSRLSTTQIYTQVGIDKLIQIYDKAHPKAKR